MATMIRLVRRVRLQLRKASPAIAAWLPWPRNAAWLPPGRVPPSPTAFSRFGAGSWIVPPVEIVGPSDIEIGADAVVMEHGALVARNGGRIYIGDRTVLARGVRVTATSSVVLGDSVLTSDFVTIADSVVVHDGAYLGYGAVIGPGVTIGAGAVIGEGAVVEHDVPPHTVVAGDPAAAIRRYDGITGAWIDEPHG